MTQSSEALEAQDQFYLAKLQEKYCKNGERDANDVFRRVARGLSMAEAAANRADWKKRFQQAMQDGFYPAGRIMSACGTDIDATLINCFVQPVGDSIAGVDGSGKPGIFLALLESAETMRRGGGVGYDFSSLRPAGAKVHGTRSRSSGPISYMRVFDRMCETVESAGARRGAQMGVLRVDHPDIESFILAKDIRTAAQRLRKAGLQGRELDEVLQSLRTLSNFNISVAMTDDFLEAVHADGEFDLVHRAEPDAGEHPQAFQRGDGLWVYRRIQARELFDLIMRTTYETADPGVIFVDRMNAENNLAYCERIEATNPCGEQPLPAYGCCCLGSFNLALYVDQPFSTQAAFNWDRFRSGVRTSVRMLDNALDVSYWPLPAQRHEAQSKRRIGLGFTGLATAMAMMRLRYGSGESLKFATRIAETLRDHAYRASVELAQERGAFPLFDAEQYLRSGFAQRLPEEIRNSIRMHGIRNSHLLSIAPTGTISLTFGRNVSGGIEPSFAWEYQRTAKAADGSRVSYPVQDLGYRYWLASGGSVDSLPEWFVSAQDLNAGDHLAVQAAVQPYVDTSISKTVNVPVDYPFADFRELYLKAWRLGLKGCTTYRPNDVTGAVLTVPEAAKAAHAPTDTMVVADPDRRLHLRSLPTPALSSLRWPGRPEIRGGNPSWTYMVEDGPIRFAIFIGHIDDGAPLPFEVWVSGDEQPRGLAAIAKLLSMDMRSQDRGWLRNKLDALVKTSGNPMRIAMPPDNRLVTWGSPTAVLAALVRHRCEDLGTFSHPGPTPVLDALMSIEEPKTGAEGALSWTVDVKNHNTGDDFVLTLKEVLLPDGSRRPVSIWLSGEYPRDLDGLCRLLSLDCRVIDPAWIGEKLRKLLNYAEPMGDFLAQIPGSDKQRNWPSTIAYMAALMMHRYQRLGILDEEGRALSPMGVLAEGHAPPAEGLRTLAGKPCRNCGAHAVIRRDGCDFCTACGDVGHCG